MERKISFADLQKTVADAYENFKSNSEGTVKADVADQKADAFGISVVLTDGRTVEKGDTSLLTPLGSIAKIAVASVLLGQKSKDAPGNCPSGCCGGKKLEKPQVGVSSRGVRAVSLVQPQGDREGKMDIITGALDTLVGSATVLNDKMYEGLRKTQADEKAVDAFAQAQFTLYDDTDLSLDIYSRLISLQATATQIATLGATLAADGVNPVTKQIAFDGSLAAKIVTLVALQGPHHEKKAFALRVGLPTKRGYAGSLLAILPGFGAIAVYAPKLDENGVSVKGFKALEYIAQTLGLNIFASARVGVDK